MNLRRRIVDFICRSAIGDRAVHDRQFRPVVSAAEALAVNLAYGLYHGVLGFLGRSWWFVASCAYYIILGATRAAALLCERRGADEEAERFVLRFSGVLLLLLGITLAGINYMSLADSIATRYGEIVMITIAAYTFTKLTMTIIRMVRQRRDPSALRASLRCISCAEVAVSVLTLQRSMLVSFDGMTAAEIRLMNALTGGGVFALLLFLGIWMLHSSLKGNKYGKSEDRTGK